MNWQNSSYGRSSNLPSISSSKSAHAWPGLSWIVGVVMWLGFGLVSQLCFEVGWVDPEHGQNLSG